MDIIGKTISQKTEEFVIKCYAQISGKIEYGILPEKYKAVCYGLANIISDRNYQVALRDDLPIAAFEANLCHELYHIVQDNIGFPQILPKNNDDKDFKELAVSISSLVRDLDVYRILQMNSVDNSYFINDRYTKAKLEFSNANPNDYLNTPAINAFKVALLLFNLTTQQYNEITCMINRVSQRLLEEAIIIKKIVDIEGFDKPEKCLKSFGEILSNYKLWLGLKIRIGDSQIKTHKQYEEYLGI